MIHYVSLHELVADTVELYKKLPHDYDLVVGVPRSGMIPASILSLLLNTRLVDLAGFIEGRVFSHGLSRTPREESKETKVLIVDDSMNTGAQMESVRKGIENAMVAMNIVYAVVYANNESRSVVDYHSKLIQNPRVFEWNIMNHAILKNACVDIDGVLCRDPTEEENDDGVEYVKFLLNVKPICVPNIKIGSLVTNRLEKYRNETEAWLKKWGVEYEELVMSQYATGWERRMAGRHAEEKAKYYRDCERVLFIESSHLQALRIAEISRKSVYSYENKMMINKWSKTAKSTDMSIVSVIKRFIGEETYRRMRNIIR